MRKGIYLGLVLRVEPQLEADRELPEVRARLEKAIARTRRQLSGQIKRLRVRDGKLEGILYFTGEQDAPQSFTELALTDVREALAALLDSPAGDRTRLTLETLEEDTDAVDDLADEEGLA